MNAKAYETQSKHIMIRCTGCMRVILAGWMSEATAYAITYKDVLPSKCSCGCEERIFDEVYPTALSPVLCRRVQHTFAWDYRRMLDQFHLDLDEWFFDFYNNGGDASQLYDQAWLQEKGYIAQIIMDEIKRVDAGKVCPTCGDCGDGCPTCGL